MVQREPRRQELALSKDGKSRRDTDHTKLPLEMTIRYNSNEEMIFKLVLVG